MPPAIAGGLRPGLRGGMVSASPSSTSLTRRTRVPFLAPRSPCCVRGAAVFCGAMASGGWSFTTILQTLGGPARGVVRPGRYASGAGSTVTKEVTEKCQEALRKELRSNLEDLVNKSCEDMIDHQDTISKAVNEDMRRIASRSLLPDSAA